ncbi:MAG: hypothetical protein OXE77_08575 [Flavobacteriaceae bacterium]|nr:hypothetical protein [Flavobacteriaceae bacterium]MCY4267270.1 hypothetical protein [Flavobacteriaceae bacterium]
MKRMMIGTVFLSLLMKTNAQYYGVRNVVVVEIDDCEIEKCWDHYFALADIEQIGSEIFRVIHQKSRSERALVLFELKNNLNMILGKLPIMIRNLSWHNWDEIDIQTITFQYQLIGELETFILMAGIQVSEPNTDFVMLFDVDGMLLIEDSIRYSETYNAVLN